MPNKKNQYDDEPRGTTRYGMDGLGAVILVAGLICIVLSFFGAGVDTDAVHASVYRGRRSGDLTKPIAQHPRTWPPARRKTRRSPAASRARWTKRRRSA